MPHRWRACATPPGGSCDPARWSEAEKPASRRGSMSTRSFHRKVESRTLKESPIGPREKQLLLRDKGQVLRPLVARWEVRGQALPAAHLVDGLYCPCRLRQLSESVEGGFFGKRRRRVVEALC